MTVEQIRKLHREQPFHPFDIHLAGGRTVAVEHPEMLAISPPGRTIGVGMPDGTIEIIDLLRVTSLKSHANGSKRRPRRS